MKRRNLILTLLVFAMVLGASIQPAIAYFTTYVTAKGGYQVSVGDTTEIKEKLIGNKKQVVISNRKDSEPVFVRAKVLYTGTYSITVSGTDWVANSDGYYYYGKILNGGEETATLSVVISALITSEDPGFKDLKDGESFSVVVVYESTPVRYRADGTAYADWDAKIVEVGSTTGGNS